MGWAHPVCVGNLLEWEQHSFEKGLLLSQNQAHVVLRTETYDPS